MRPLARPAGAKAFPITAAFWNADWAKANPDLAHKVMLAYVRAVTGPCESSGDGEGVVRAGRRADRVTPRVKICGVTTPQDAAMVADAGADAIGVLVGLAHASEDELSPERAGAILAALPPFVAGTLVTHRTEVDEICRLFRAVRPQVLQLHGDVAVGAIAALRDALPGVRIVKTIHVDGERALDAARAAAPHVDAILLDTRTATRIGGTGLTHDWSISRRIRDGLPATPVILAGGLTPDNVAAAIRRVAPYGVDVNSGVSVRRGRKSPELVERFVRSARSVRGPD